MIETTQPQKRKMVMSLTISVKLMPMIMLIGNADTLLDDEPVSHDRSYTFAPGEGQHPLSLYSDKDAEFLSFPAIFLW